MSLNDATLNYETPDGMKEVWAVQIDLLKRLLDVCNKHNLKIWADGGTLLGTIRHQGYIPWDDDIDMAMLREDYDKLIAIGEKEFQHPYFLQSGYVEEFNRGFARLRNSNTTGTMSCDIEQKFNQGIFIDIFVYDAVPEDEKELEDLMKLQRKYRSLLWCKLYGKFLTRSLRALGRKIISTVYFSFHSYHSTFKKFDDIFRRNKIEEHKEVACLAFRPDLIHLFRRDKKWYEETIFMPFEDIMMPVPAGYDKILTKQYGDYMKPAKAPSFHSEIIFDVNTPYKEYLRKIRKGK